VFWYHHHHHHCRHPNHGLQPLPHSESQLEVSLVKNMWDSSGYWWHPIRITYQLSLASVTTTATTTFLNGFVVSRISFDKDNWLEVQVMESEINETQQAFRPTNSCNLMINEL
jgi:hypothetical protein